jgi:hypothetical protein
MKKQDLLFCAECTDRALASWKGWPHRDAVPLLPLLEAGHCESCGASDVTPGAEIVWLNIHSEFSTGLPDYWVLKADGQPSKWGLPYYAVGQCPRCSSPSIISEMNYPNGRHELKCNCERCGVRNLEP